MSLFIIIGIFGLALLLISLLLGDVLDGVADVFDLDSGGYLSGPAIGAFIGSFGFGAAIVKYNTDWGSGAAALSGIAIGLAVGGVVGLASRSLMNIQSDEPVKAADLLGAKATVVTRIPPGGMGEVTLVQAGQFMKVSARSLSEVNAGTAVEVTSVLSSTSVVVAPVSLDQR